MRKTEVEHLEDPFEKMRKSNLPQKSNPKKKNKFKQKLKKLSLKTKKNLTPQQQIIQKSQNKTVNYD